MAENFSKIICTGTQKLEEGEKQSIPMAFRKNFPLQPFQQKNKNKNKPKNAFSKSKKKGL